MRGFPATVSPRPGPALYPSLPDGQKRTASCPGTRWSTQFRPRGTLSQAGQYSLRHSPQVLMTRTNLGDLSMSPPALPLLTYATGRKPCHLTETILKKWRLPSPLFSLTTIIQALVNTHLTLEERRRVSEKAQQEAKRPHEL